MMILIPSLEHFAVAELQMREPGLPADTVAFLRTLLFERGDPLLDLLIDVARDGTPGWKTTEHSRLIAAGVLLGLLAERARVLRKEGR
jgi:hypothetical protein